MRVDQVAWTYFWLIMHHQYAQSLFVSLHALWYTQQYLQLQTWHGCYRKLTSTPAVCITQSVNKGILKDYSSVYDSNDNFKLTAHTLQ